MNDAFVVLGGGDPIFQLLLNDVRNITTKEKQNKNYILNAYSFSIFFLKLFSISFIDYNRKECEK